MEVQLQKIAISGPTLASMIQRCSSSPGDVDGFLYGHVTQITPSNLSDDSSDESASQLIATITSFLCPGFNFSFYDSAGRVNLLRVPHHQQHLIGWFSARRQSPLRPSMREFSVTNSLTKIPKLQFSVSNLQSSATNQNLTPCIFILFTTPLTDQLIHTHQYRAYQFNISSKSFQPKSIDIVNIGPAFRGHYSNFTPNCALPLLNCETRNSAAMNEESLSAKKEKMNDQQQLDLYTEGFQIDNLSRLMGSEAVRYTGGVEDFYERMLAKVEGLARHAESSSAKVLELVSLYLIFFCIS